MIAVLFIIGIAVLLCVGLIALLGIAAEFRDSV